LYIRAEIANLPIIIIFQEEAALIKILFITICILFTGIFLLPMEPLFAQDDVGGEIADIITVNDVKQLMADAFDNIVDYIADIEWVNGNVHYKGKISYKKANKILIEFDEPEDQVISSNGTFLYIYIPYLKVVIQQSLGEDTESTLLASTSEAGLTKLFDEYSFTFFDSPSPQPFGNIMAYHLKLDQKRPKVGFRKMDIWVSRNGFIIQSNGTSPNGLDVSLTFKNIRINTELPDYIFEFEVPADAQIIRNIIIPFSDTKQEVSSE
jgi:outer membrane lipoprotein-sorting protein